MVNIKRILLAVVLIALAVFVARRFFVGDESKIRRKLSALAESVSKDPSEKGGAMLVKTEQLRGLFARECRLVVPRYDIKEVFSPTEIVQRALQLRRSLQRIDIDFHDITVEIHDDTHAHVRCTVRASASRGGENSETETAEIVCELQKIDGEWLFTRFEQVPVLE